MLKSADTLVSADSSKRNQDSPTLEQLNYKAKLHLEQSKSREIIDKKEHQKAELDLENDIEGLDDTVITTVNLQQFIDEKFAGNSEALELAQIYLEKQSVFGAKVSSKKLIEKIILDLANSNEISSADKIKDFTESIRQGKSQSEILKTLIAKFENVEAVSTWVDNWKNFQKLSSFAENKPPKERNAIQKIIATADFSNENSFTSSLTEISQSEEISNETKLEISREFMGGEKVFSVDEMDTGLQHMKTRKAEFAKALSNNKNQTTELNSEISELEDEIKTLAPDDPKRKDLETQITRKQEKLMYAGLNLHKLKKEKPEEVSFKLREGFSAKLNDDGSRSIRINALDFSIQIPSNRFPFTNKRNIRSINLAFPYKVLRDLKIADVIFSPDLVNNSVPSKSQRDMGHLILSSLGFDDLQILSETDITKLKKDLGQLVNPENGKSGKEDLIASGVFDVKSRVLDMERFQEILDGICRFN